MICGAALEMHEWLTGTIAINYTTRLPRIERQPRYAKEQDNENVSINWRI